MSMTNASMDSQTKRSVDGANDQPVAGFDPNVVVQTKDQSSSLKPGDANWSHCDTPNGSAASVTPGTVVKPAVPDAGKPRTSGSGVPENDPYNV